VLLKRRAVVTQNLVVGVTEGLVEELCNELPLCKNVYYGLHEVGSNIHTLSGSMPCSNIGNAKTLPFFKKVGQFQYNAFQQAK
jgi:hypothetical protein